MFSEPSFLSLSLVNITINTIITTNTNGHIEAINIFLKLSLQQLHLFIITIGSSSFLSSFLFSRFISFGTSLFFIIISLEPINPLSVGKLYL